MLKYNASRDDVLGKSMMSTYVLSQRKNDDRGKNLSKSRKKKRKKDYSIIQPIEERSELEFSENEEYNKLIKKMETNFKRRKNNEYIEEDDSEDDMFSFEEEPQYVDKKKPKRLYYLPKDRGLYENVGAEIQNLENELANQETEYDDKIERIQYKYLAKMNKEIEKVKKEKEERAKEIVQKLESLKSLMNQIELKNKEKYKKNKRDRYEKLVIMKPKRKYYHNTDDEKYKKKFENYLPQRKFYITKKEDEDFDFEEDLGKSRNFKPENVRKTIYGYSGY
jgi:hypothetical protein